MDRVEELLGQEPADQLRSLYLRLRGAGRISVRDFTHRTTYKKAEKVRAIFAEWEKRKYGKIEEGFRKDQMVFVFDKG